MSELVDFLIVGSMRCGSTTLRELLDRHPSLSLPSQGLYFFSFKSNYDQGHDWYERQVLDLTEERSTVGEKCVSYGFVPESRDRIFSYSPEIQLIWILRDPVERAYSHYLHNVNNGLEQRSFAEAIDDEREGKTTSQFQRYLQRSRYVEEILRFREQFSARQMYLLKLEDLREAPRDTLRPVFDFLGVDHRPYEFRPVTLNKGYRTAFPSLVGWCARHFGYLSAPHRAARHLRLPFPNSPLDSDLRLHLPSYFASYNRRLQQETGLDLQDWRTQDGKESDS